jgi:acetoin utilization protein AcuB
MSRYAIRRHMSVSVHSVTSRHTLAEAHQVMRERGVRHLAVIDEGRLVGVVSQRDLYLLETLKGVDAARELVEEAMTSEPFVVGPDAPLDEVAEQMAHRRHGSALVLESETVVGIFTTTDALKALVAVLRKGRRGREEAEEDG